MSARVSNNYGVKLVQNDLGMTDCRTEFCSVAFAIRPISLPSD